MIKHLPLEVLNLVLDYLHQPELVSLNLTNKELHHLIIPRLFKCIEINSRKSILAADEYPECDSGFNSISNSTTSTSIADDLALQLLHKHVATNGVRENCIKITSIYNLKCFLKRLIQHPEYCSLIHHLVFKSLPDIPEDFLIDYFNRIFPSLTNLIEFRWYSNYNLDLSLINSIPTSKLLVLNGNFKNFEKFSGNFMNLKSLSLSDFKNFNNVRIDLSQFKQLESLKISKKNLIIIDDMIDNLLINPTKLNLKALNLTNLYLTPQDITSLLKSIEFRNLQYLKLINCYEFFDSTGINPSDASHNLGNNLLNRLSHLDLRHLTKVELNVCNNECNNGYVYKFLSSLPNLILCKALLNINNDLSKHLLQLVNHLPANNLRHLEINFHLKTHMHGRNNSQLLNVNNFTEFINQLNRFSRLNHLQFPILSRNLIDLYLSLPNLMSLQLNLIDLLKVNNSLINFEMSTDLSSDYFPYILRKLPSCKLLMHLMIKLDKLYVYDVHASALTTINL